MTTLNVGFKAADLDDIRRKNKCVMETIYCCENQPIRVTNKKAGLLFETTPMATILNQRFFLWQNVWFSFTYHVRHKGRHSFLSDQIKDEKNTKKKNLLCLKNLSPNGTAPFPRHPSTIQFLSINR